MYVHRFSGGGHLTIAITLDEQRLIDRHDLTPSAVIELLGIWTDPPASEGHAYAS